MWRDYIKAVDAFNQYCRWIMAVFALPKADAILHLLILIRFFSKQELSDNNNR